MAQARPLTLELLEDRTAPAAFDVPWPEAKDLTLSFAPDGTPAGGQASVLFQTLDARMPTRAWQQEVLRAFQTWAAEADVNVGLVSDGGQPFGTLGLKQGDPRFGDVRVGAFPMAGDVLAVTDPYDPFVANTWVGDVFLNGAYRFGTAGRGDPYDLFSVLLHEAGHVFGVGHSADPNSPMYPQLNTVRAGLTPGDVAALRALYGPRRADGFEGPAGNDTFATATAVDLGAPGGHPSPASLEADVTTHQDVDVYRLLVPGGADTLDVRLTAAGVSLLVARLTVYDASGDVVGSALAPDPLDNNLSLRYHVRPGSVYYVKVEGGSADAFGIGTYVLGIDPHPAGADAPSPPPDDDGPADPPGGIRLLATTPGYVEHTYYEAGDTAGAAAPAHTYRVRSADLGPDMTNVMTVVVATPGNEAARFRVDVRDDRGNEVAATVIADGAGHYAVQVPNVLSGRDYSVEVRGDDLGEAREVRYQVTVDFAQDASHLETFVSETLDKDTRESVRTLEVVQSQQFHFVLSATDWSAPAETGVRMTVSDAGGRDVFTAAVPDGATRSADVFLGRGSYTVRFTRATGQEGPLTPVHFKLSGTGLSDPLGPQLRDTTLAPVDSAAAPATAALTFYWLPYGPGAVPGSGTRDLAPPGSALGDQPATGVNRGGPSSDVIPPAPRPSDPRVGPTGLIAQADATRDPPPQPPAGTPPTVLALQGKPDPSGSGGQGVPPLPRGPGGAQDGGGGGSSESRQDASQTGFTLPPPPSPALRQLLAGAGVGGEDQEVVSRPAPPEADNPGVSEAPERSARAGAEEAVRGGLPPAGHPPADAANPDQKGSWGWGWVMGLGALAFSTLLLSGRNRVGLVRGLVRLARLPSHRHGQPGPPRPAGPGLPSPRIP